MSFQTFSRPALRVRWGVEHLAAELDRCGAERPVLVCAPSVARDADLLGLLTRSAGRDLAGVISDVRPHSPVDAVVAAADQLGAADAVVVAGGGSAMVTARAANILRCEGGDPAALSTYRDRRGKLVSPRLHRPKLPMIVLPTTPTTAATKAGAAVTRTESAGRLALFDPAVRARCVIVDPALGAGTPEQVVRAAALNALVMALEGMTTRRRNLFADAQLGYVVRHLPGRLRAFAEFPRDLDLRVELALLALMVGDGTDSSGGGFTAALSHTIGHRVHTHNGVVDAIVLPHVLQLVARRDPESLSSVAEVLGCTNGVTATAVQTLLAQFSVPQRLRDVGVTQADVAPIAHAALDDFAASGMTFSADASDLQKVLDDAL